MTTDTANNNDALYQHLASEAGEITWPELEPHFARGVLIVVSDKLDLIDVATCAAQDERVEMENWMQQGLVERARDDHAHRWNLSKPLFRAVVLAPWVLVQEARRH